MYVCHTSIPITTLHQEKTDRPVYHHPVRPSLPPPSSDNCFRTQPKAIKSTPLDSHRNEHGQKNAYCTSIFTMGNDFTKVGMRGCLTWYVTVFREQKPIILDRRVSWRHLKKDRMARISLLATLAANCSLKRSLYSTNPDFASALCRWRVWAICSLNTSGVGRDCFKLFLDVVGFTV